jgi:hypothetical protein
MQIASFVNCMTSVVCGLSASIIFIHIISKRHDFGKKKVEQKRCVLIFSETLSEIFLILRRIQRDITMNLQRSSCKIRVIHIIL